MSDSFATFFGSAIAVITLAGLAALLVLSMRVCIRDAQLRGKSPALVCIACILFFPWGTVAWLVFRPDPRDGPGSGTPFRLKDHRIQ